MSTELSNRDNLEYRRSTVGLVLNDRNELLLIQKKIYREDQWNFPGGGVDEGETQEQAIMREFREELGTSKFEIVRRSSLVDRYEWPDHLIEDYFKNKGVTFRGQEMTQFLVRFLGSDSDLVLEDTLRQAKWVKLSELQNYLVFSNQWDNARKLLQEFDLVEKGK